MADREEEEGGRKSPKWRVIRTPEMCLGAFGLPLFEENAKVEEINPLPSTFSRITRFLFLFDIKISLMIALKIKKKSKTNQNYCFKKNENHSFIFSHL